MVSLDEQIQKDRQKHRSQRKQPRGNDRRVRVFRNDRRDFPDKRRGIRKDDRRRQGPTRRFRNDRQNRGPRRVDRVDRQQRRLGQGSRISRIKRDVKGKSRISRVPRKQSPQNSPQEGNQQKGRTLKVMGLHPDFSNSDLYKLFSTQGALQKCLIEQDNFGRSLTTAIVKYHNATSAKSAITNLNQHKVMNSILTVQPYKNKRR